MWHGRWIVTTEQYVQKPDGGGKLTKKTVETFTSASSVADDAESMMRSYRNVASGLEGFGEGSCVEDTAHGCAPGNGVCKKYEYEGAREWVESRSEELRHGETFDLTVSGTYTPGKPHKYCGITVEFRDDEPEED